MYKIKKEIEEERSKEKHWFKFMFDKNSKEKNDKSSSSTVADDPQNCNSKEDEKTANESEKTNEQKKLNALLEK